jgi:hypothetical protein
MIPHNKEERERRILTDILCQQGYLSFILEGDIVKVYCKEIDYPLFSLDRGAYQDLQRHLDGNTFYPYFGPHNLLTKNMNFLHYLYATRDMEKMTIEETSPYLFDEIEEVRKAAQERIRDIETKNRIKIIR